MQSVPLIVPKVAPPQRFRPPKKNIPQTKFLRDQILQSARRYVAEYNPVPPLPLEELRGHAARLTEMLGCDPLYLDYIGVLINNEIWRETLAAIPYSRRLLLLPKCLRVESKCPAPFDEFGLLCKQCGLCSIQDLQNEAERLGYAVLVAEGSAIVMSLIQTGKIEAIVGVSCLSVLERAFPYMEAAAIPGVAIPLLQDDCIDTTVDLEWIWDYLHLTSDDTTRRLDLSALRREVESWFAPETLDQILGPGQGETDALARQWLARAGKRWRPFLTVAAFQALRPRPDAPLPADLKQIAVAVECFHKASLIHDDIEDDDGARYGEKTLHQEHGLPLALNAGDHLIGEGYRLLADSGASAEQKIRMLQVAAAGHRQLCLGQGAELFWTRHPAPLTVAQVLDIFRQKTAPAFDVSLRLGALCARPELAQPARADPLAGPIEETLQAYSQALGIAYQIRDDLEDHAGPEGNGDLPRLRPNLLLAIAWERARDSQKEFLANAWRSQSLGDGAPLAEILEQAKAGERARALLETYKEEAIRSLRQIENPNLKGLLRRVIGKIFNDAEIKGWCKEFEEKNGRRQPARQ